MEKRRSVLNKSGDGDLQAFPLIEGYIALTSTNDDVENASMIRCISNGSITITFNSEAEKTITMVEGDVYALPDDTSVAINGGTFHFC